MEFIILFKYAEDEDYYYPVQAGRGVVPNESYDKVLPVEEHVAYQFHKIFFQNGKLQVKKEYKDDFMDEKEYFNYLDEYENEDSFGGTGALIKEEDAKPKITKVEF